MLMLSVAQTLAIAPDTGTARRFNGAVSACFYSVTVRSGVEVIAFHHHPIGIGIVPAPHLHIGPAATGSDAMFLSGRFHKAHIPTGGIALERVIHMLITEFGVEPRRADWERVLADE